MATLHDIIRTALRSNTMVDELASRIANSVKSAAKVDGGTYELVDYQGPRFTPSGAVPADVIANRMLVTVVAIDHAYLTKTRVARSYAEGGPALPPFQRVYSVGQTALDAIKALGEKIGWGKLTDFREIPMVEDGEWHYRFLADGAGMQAGGRMVPGGAVLDWWK